MVIICIDFGGGGPFFPKGLFFRRIALCSGFFSNDMT